MSAAKKYNVGDVVLIGGTRFGLVNHVVTKVGRKWMTARREHETWCGSRYDMSTGKGEFPGDGYITTAEAEDQRRLVHLRTQSLAKRGIRVEHRAAVALGAEGLKRITDLAIAHGIGERS